MVPPRWRGRGGRLTAAICRRAWRRRVCSSRKRFVSAEHTYDYAIIRVMPRVERGELINVGVILSCPAVDFLESQVEIDEATLLAVDQELDLEAVRANLATIPVICRGGPEAGPIGALPQRHRFRWLVSPRSTMIQMSPVHTGRTADPAAALAHLMKVMVRRPPVTRRPA